jgi:hypothetical protein
MAETKLWLVRLAVPGPAEEFKVAATDAYAALAKGRLMDGGKPREQVSAAFFGSAVLDDAPIPQTVADRLAALEADVAGLKGK